MTNVGPPALCGGNRTGCEIFDNLPLGKIGREVTGLIRRPDLLEERQGGLVAPYGQPTSHVLLTS